MVNYITTPFLSKPPGGSLPELRAHPFASNWQLALLESAGEGISFQERMYRTRGSISGPLLTKWTRYRPSYHGRNMTILR